MSFSALVSDPNRWFPFKVVDKPWVGEYNIRQGINVVEDDYLKNIYGSSLINLYRSHLKSVFPVAYGEDYSISYPVDADIVKNKSHWFGVIDNSYTDLYTYRENLSGYGYLKKEHSGTNFPPLYHTWAIKSMKNCIVHIEYYSVTDKTPKLELIPLRAAHLIETNCDDKKTTFTVLINDILGILSVKSTKGTFLVDAMHIYKE